MSGKMFKDAQKILTASISQLPDPQPISRFVIALGREPINGDSFFGVDLIHCSC
jgi:hypothetical protein